MGMDLLSSHFSRADSEQVSPLCSQLCPIPRWMWKNCSPLEWIPGSRLEVAGVFFSGTASFSFVVR